MRINGGGDSELTAIAQIAARYPILSFEREQSLARSWRSEGDIASRDELAAAHLRLVVKMTRRMLGYGVSAGELYAEGCEGLTVAIDRFEPEKGFRLSTYAMWWIRAAMTDYVLRNWSMVKVATSANHRTLFFRLKAIKRRLGILHDGDLTDEEARQVAEASGTEPKDAFVMNRRIGISGDASLNAGKVGTDGSDLVQWQDAIRDEGPDPFDLTSDVQVDSIRRKVVGEAMVALTDRERTIVTERHLTDEVKTLEELSRVYGVSRERVRQIEAKALKKIASRLSVLMPFGVSHILTT
jgi:RNA polymerase sigma-32 factor